MFEYELLDGEATVTYRGERHLREAAGVADGMSGGRASAVIRRAGGGATAGGGGYGPPAERHPALVQADLRNGKVSLEAAREFYAYRGNA